MEQSSKRVNVNRSAGASRQDEILKELAHNRKIVHELQRKISILADELKSIKQKERDDMLNTKYKAGLDAMKIIAAGGTLESASLHIGRSSAYTHDLIRRAWRELLRSHYNANYDKIKSMGLLPALRYSLPLFTS